MTTSEFFRASTFNTILVADFTERKKRRPSYSLRAYSRDLGIKPHTFTGIFKGKYGISEATARQIAEKLNFSEEKSDFFAALANSRHARTKVEREEAKLILRKFRAQADWEKVDAERMEIFKNWYYPAVLELVSQAGGVPNTSQIAKRLGITRAEVQKVLRIAVKFPVEKNIGATKQLTVDSPLPSELVKGFHKQILKKAIEAVDQQPIQKRKNLSTVMGFDAARTEEARQWLTKMHQSFVDEFGTSSKSNVVYGFGLQLFQLDTGDLS